MDGRVPLSEEVWERTPAEARALILSSLQRTEALEAKVKALEARLGRNSRNSSHAPSTGFVGVKRRPPKKPSGRKRGGQPGHPRHERTLLPTADVDAVVSCVPEQCEHCNGPLSGSDASPIRHQVAELPPIKPHVVEYQRHALSCPTCHHTTTAPLPDGVPTGHFGPRLSATLSVLAGGYRLSKRQIKQLASDLFGLSVSTGMICKLEKKTSEILAPVYNELSEHVKDRNAGCDETSWRENKKRAWLWTVTTAAATVFHIAATRGGAVARKLLGEAFAHVLNCDRYSVYRRFKRLQWCWAHLRRDFQAMIDRGGEAKGVGEALLAQSDQMFQWWWNVRDGTMSRQAFRRRMKPLRETFLQTLSDGVECRCAATASTCAQLYDDERWLWTFVRREGIEPTNNATERAHRHAVQWRRSSGGTDSATGSRYVERMLTVIATCRQQGRNLLDYLAQCHETALAHQPPPSLLPQNEPLANAA